MAFSPIHAPGRMRRDAVRDHVESHGAVAAALDAAIGRLADDREIAGEPIGMRLGHLAQAVLLGRNLLMVVEHVRQVVLRVRPAWRRGTGSPRRMPFMSVRAAAPHHALAAGAPAATSSRISGSPGMQPARREVVDHRHRVKVPGEHHAASACRSRRGRHHRVAVPAHRQVRLSDRRNASTASASGPLVIADGIGAHDLFEQ